MLYLNFHLSVSQLKYVVTKCWIKSVPLQMFQAVLSHCMNMLEINVILKKVELFNVETDIRMYHPHVTLFNLSRVH